MSNHHSSFHVEEHEEIPVEIAEELKKFSSSGDFCDVELVVNDKKFTAHKVILAAVSSSLRKRFMGSYSESFKLPGIQPCALEVILDYAYGKKFEITENNVQDVIHAAHDLQVSDVENKGFQFLVSKISTGNCVGLYQLAKKYKNDQYQKTAKNFVLRYFHQVHLEEEFLQMSADDLSDMISDENLFVDNEDEVFMSVLQWFLSDENQHSRSLDKVLRHVRLSYVNRLNEHFERVKALQKSNFYSEFLTQTHSNAVVQQASKWRPCWPVEVLVIYLTRLNSPSDIREVCISEAGVVLKERVIENSERRLFKSTVILHGETTAAINGEKRSLEIYDMDTFSWKELTEISHKRGSGYACIGNDWYVMGGLSEHGDAPTTNKVFRWNSITKEKEELEPMNTDVCNPAVVTLGGKIYVFGGLQHADPDDEEMWDHDKFYRKRKYGRHWDYDSDGSDKEPPITAVNTLQQYDIERNTWNDFTMPQPENRQVVGACSLNGDIFCFRRHYAFDDKDEERSAKPGSQQQVFVFNPTTGQWRICGDLNYIFVSGPVVFKGAIYVVSKTITWRNDKRAEHFVERFSSATNTWQVFTEFPGFLPEAVLGPLKVRCVKYDDHINDVQIRLL